MFTLIQKFIQTLLIPALLLAAIVALTMAAYEYRELQVGLRQADDAEQIGIGRSVPVAPELGEWVKFYGGGHGLDKVVSRDEASLRVTTGADGGWYGARAGIKTVDLSDQAIVFSVRADEWDHLDRFMVMFASDSNFQNYYGVNLKQFYAFPASDEWITVIIEKSEFEVIEGDPDWSTIAGVGVRVVPTIGIATRVWFDDLAFIEKQATEPIITMTFDDSFDAVIEAYSLMDARDMRGTIYNIPEFVDTPGYMTQSQIDILADAGWDISGHGKTNLLTMEFADTDTDLARAFEYLEAHEYTKGIKHFAYPNGGYDANNRSQVTEYFVTGRTIDGFSQPQDYLIPSAINAKTVSSTTPPDQIIDWVNDAKEDNSWLIIVWHDFVDGKPVADVEYNLDDFNEVLQTITALDITVLPFSEAYERVLSPIDSGVQ